METIFRWSGETPPSMIKKSCVLLNSTTLKIGIDLGYKVDITQRVTNFKVYYKGPAKSGQHVVNEVLVLYYHDPTHNNELESEDKEQQQHSEDVGNEDEEEEEEEEKEDATSRAQPRNDAPNVEYAQCFKEMNEIPLNEVTGEISDDDEDSDRLPSDGDSSGGEEDGQKKTSKKK
ncbi:unnamed protein product [Prunus armeniaca]|uniref:Uncharacterized protein n=1 Tax=Prunus armeniaca TaxID=36596 RepID=A0A6J5TKT5_PRUAR|nr:unnamed protein product [Prunus armeniaca]